MSFDAQIKRIKQKLVQARAKDADFNVFGAASHRYELLPPLPEHIVRRFEQERGIELPEAYRAFITQVGSGGDQFGGAGPYYGIYRFGHYMYLPVDDRSLSLPCRIHRRMTPEEWEAMTAFYRNDGSTPEPDEEYDFEDEDESGDEKLKKQAASDEEFDRQYNEIFHGILPIGTQGCSGHTVLLLNGEDKGRVVYINDELYQPFFTHEDNFLDWYERWLDEVIGGYEIFWFGMNMGGDDVELMQKFRQHTDTDYRINAIAGLNKLPAIRTETIDFLVQQCSNAEPGIRRIALQLLSKYACHEAIPFLEKNFASEDEKDICSAAQNIYWYAKPQAAEWIAHARAALPKVQEEETFRFIMYIFAEGKYEDADLLVPFFDHPSASIRKSALYAAGLLLKEKKAPLLEHFRKCLYDPNIYVKCTALEALRDLNDTALLPGYEKILADHLWNESYILSLVLLRLEEMGRAAFPLLEKAAKHPDQQIAQRAISFLEKHGKEAGALPGAVKK